MSIFTTSAEIYKIALFTFLRNRERICYIFVAQPENFIKPQLVGVSEFQLVVIRYGPQSIFDIAIAVQSDYQDRLIVWRELESLVQDDRSNCRVYKLNFYVGIVSLQP